MQYLILGGAGFLGTWLTTALLSTDKSNNVIVFDKENSDFSRVSDDHVEIRKGNFAKYENFDDLVSGCDVVFHLISSTIPTNFVGKSSILSEINEDVSPTIRLLDACAKEKVGKIVFFSSGGTVYGNKLNSIPINETNPTNPISSYGIQKLMIEKYIQLYNSALGLNYHIIRLSNPFGPYQNPLGNQGALSAFAYRIVNDLPITIYGEGKVIRDFIEVRDAINMVLKIVNSERLNETYNVGSGIGYSIQQCVGIIEKVSGKKALVNRVNARPFDVPVNILDISKYLSEICTTRPHGIEEGIESLVRYYYDFSRQRS
jgi:UDP-glucose 4-epimerase